MPVQHRLAVRPFPKAFLQEAGRRNLMGCLYPVEWYQEYDRRDGSNQAREVALDAAGALDRDEKIYA